MNRSLRKARVLLEAQYAYMLEYRAELYLWVLAGVLPLFMLGVWAQAGASGEFALSEDEFIRYFLAVFIVRQLTIVWVIWHFELHVVQGTLSFHLLQPINPVWRYLAEHISERFARLPFAVLVVGVLGLLYPHALMWPSMKAVTLGLLACVASFALRFIIQYTFAMFSFWTERASAIDQFFFLFYFFLSGMVAPLEVFPEWVRSFALLTPYPYLVWFPAQLLVGGSLSDAEIARAFAITGVWFVVFYVAYRMLWRAGLKRFSGMGA